jgi:catechol 2,3-dioxygenase-like lactoylglutathione lyase family enzyme
MREPESVVFGLSHVDVPVRDLARALVLYRDLLGFPEKARGDGWVDLDGGGTIALRLLEAARPSHRAAIRVQSSTVEVTLDALVRVGGKILHSAKRTPEQDLVGVAQDLDGNTIAVWRPLTEDEYDFVPTLSTVLTWTPDAEALLKSLLKKVPALFRGLARRRVVPVVESLAAIRSPRLVGREDVIRGFILASPRVTRGRNRQPLIDHGIDVDAYQADWDAD